jgi:TatD DNase family protein
MNDSHTHLFLCAGAEESPASREPVEGELVDRAREAGVTRMLNVGLGGEANLKAIAGAERHDDVFATVGCHPTEAAGFDEAEAAEIAHLAANEKVLAIGECGLDYYRDSSPDPVDQRRAFEAQIEIARATGLPLVIHVRDPQDGRSASDEAFALLDERAGGLTVILHCFSAPWRAADTAERGWHCSFAGHVTYPASDELREAAATLPAELVLVETDAPYLTPQPHRGKPNEPAHVVETARVVAEQRGISYEELERLVDANAAAALGW